MSEVNSIEWLKKAKGKGATHVMNVDRNFLYLVDDTGVYARYMDGDDSWCSVQGLNENRDHVVEIDYSPLEEQEKECTAESLQKNREEDKPSEKYSKYFRSVEGLTEIDVYQVHNLFSIDDHSGAIQHASKKLLLSGVRTGGKSKYQDIKEARDTLTRWLEMNNKD